VAAPSRRVREHAGCLVSNRRSHQDEASLEARVAGGAYRAGPDLAARAERFTRRAPRLPRPVHRRRPEGAGRDDGSRPYCAVRRQGSAGRCTAGRAWRQHRQPGRTERPANCVAPTASPRDDRRRTVAARLPVGRVRRPVGRGHDGRHRRGRVDAALCQHASSRCRRRTGPARRPRARCRAVSSSSARSSWRNGSRRAHR
jgi:hypothetical protein